ncbi:helix-turn-helix domain-containing protein [Streptomyces sp. NPDC056056]|uniref:helix-turn-helix domain-containing protein n=1 Tax=Streptomyces sp. NPDC056056 TaxID=3345698 RepID=UPI0035D6A920
MTSAPRSLGEKLTALMARARPGSSRRHTVRSLSADVEALPDSSVSLSRTAIGNLANGTQLNPTTDTVIALCKALGDVPPAHLLPHSSYDDLEALQAFENSAARQALVLLNRFGDELPGVLRLLTLLEGLPEAELRNVIADLKRRRDDLGLKPIPRNDPVAKQPKGRRRTADEVAAYATKALEGL